MELPVPAGPALLVFLSGPAHGQGIRRDVLGNGGTRRDIGPLAHGHRCHQVGVAADEGIVADDAAVFFKAVVIGGDGAAAKVDTTAHVGVAT